MKKTIHIEDLKEDWRDFLAQFKEYLMMPRENCFFMYAPQHGSIMINGNRKVVEGEFPNTDNFLLDTEVEFGYGDHKIIDFFHWAYFERKHGCDLYVGQELIGEYTFTRQVVEVVAHWTAEYLREVNAPIGTIYFSEGDGNVELLFKIKAV